jgi:VWFA-related protein
MKPQAFIATVALVSMTVPAPSPGQDVPTFGVGTAAVLLDIVVRDKKQQAVRDLTAADFEVFEDGVQQKVEQFHVVSRGGPPRPAAPTPAAPSGAQPSTPSVAEAEPAAPENHEPAFIAFIFDRLSANARDTAHKAALTYVNKGRRDEDVAAVFSIDLALHTIQPFTRDAERIRAAFDKALVQGNASFGSDRQEARDRIDQVTSQEALEDSLSGGAGPGADTSGIGGAAAEAQANRIRVGIIRSFESLERDQQGYASTNGLLAVVSGMKSIPGRKTVVFFSEGLVVPANVQAQFRSVISAATRANVAVYTVDAGGLRATSLTKETRDEMVQAGQRRLRQVQSGRDDGTTGAMTKGLERNEDLLNLNPEAGLGQLAQQTGGFALLNTNDAQEAFARIAEDMRFHYVLSYTPTNEAYDGRFRQIKVKVKRSGVDVHSRDGYFAVRPEGAAPLLTYEAPILARLDRSSQADDFPLWAVGLSFPEAKRPGLTPVLVEVPGTAMTYTPDATKKLLHADFSILVRIKDAQKQIADRMSQHYLLTATPTNIQNAQKGNVLFYREAALRPGKYTLEAVAYDAATQKTSIRTRSLEVPAAAQGQIRLSSLVLVKRTESVAENEKDASNPLYFGQTLIYPNMGEAYRRSVDKQLGFYFTAYTDKPGSRKVDVQVLKGGQPTGQATMDLAAPDATGRIQHAGALPLQSMAPGAYELKVIVADGPSSASASTPFTVEE